MGSWLDSRVNIRLMRESDLPLIEWDGEYTRYRKDLSRNLSRFTGWQINTLGLQKSTKLGLSDKFF